MPTLVGVAAPLAPRFSHAAAALSLLACSLVTWSVAASRECIGDCATHWEGCTCAQRWRTPHGKATWPSRFAFTHSVLSARLFCQSHGLAAPMAGRLRASSLVGALGVHPLVCRYVCVYLRISLILFLVFGFTVALRLILSSVRHLTCSPVHDARVGVPVPMSLSLHPSARDVAGRGSMSSTFDEGESILCIT